MKKIIICMIILLIAGCSSVQYKTEYDQTAKELEQELKKDNLTPEQKIIIRHAIIELTQAKKIDKENDVLKDQLVSESKKSGAGNFAYWLIGLLALGIIAYIITKIKSIF